MGNTYGALKRQGITWPQFFFQLVIVLLGVYLAIFFERKAQERSLAEDTAAMLQNVVTELEQDDAEIQRILGIVAKKKEIALEMVGLLARASQEQRTHFHLEDLGKNRRKNPRQRGRSRITQYKSEYLILQTEKIRYQQTIKIIKDFFEKLLKII